MPHIHQNQFSVLQQVINFIKSDPRYAHFLEGHLGKAREIFSERFQGAFESGIQFKDFGPRCHPLNGSRVFWEDELIPFVAPDIQSSGIETSRNSPKFNLTSLWCTYLIELVKFEEWLKAEKKKPSFSQVTSNWQGVIKAGWARTRKFDGHEVAPTHRSWRYSRLVFVCNGELLASYDAGETSERYQLTQEFLFRGNFEKRLKEAVGVVFEKLEDFLRSKGAKRPEGKPKEFDKFDFQDEIERILEKRCLPFRVKGGRIEIPRNKFFEKVTQRAVAEGLETKPNTISMTLIRDALDWKRLVKESRKKFAKNHKLHLLK